MATFVDEEVVRSMLMFGVRRATCIGQLDDPFEVIRYELCLDGDWADLSTRIVWAATGGRHRARPFVLKASYNLREFR